MSERRGRSKANRKNSCDYCYRNYRIDYIRTTLISHAIFYIASGFLPEPFLRYLSVNQYISPIIRIPILQCTETCPLLSLIRATLLAVPQPPPTHLPPHAQTLAAKAVIVTITQVIRFWFNRFYIPDVWVIKLENRWNMDEAGFMEGHKVNSLVVGKIRIRMLLKKTSGFKAWTFFIDLLLVSRLHL